MADAGKTAERKVLTPVFRVSFPWVFEPQPPMEGSAPGTKPKFSVTALFDAKAQASPEFQAMRRIAMQAALSKWGAKCPKFGPKGEWPAGLRNPLRDGAEKAELEGYGKGVAFCSLTTKVRPGLVDAQRIRIDSQDVGPSGFYAGCFARATITAYAYDRAGNRGVAFGLHNVQKVGDGAAFSGRSQAEDDFGVASDPFDDGSVPADPARDEFG